MKTLNALFFLFAITNFSSYSQTESKELEEVNDLFSNERFSAALPYYLHFLKNEPYSSDLNYKAGICYLNSRSQKTKSIEYLEKSVGGASPVIANKFLGDAYHLANKYDLAVASYENFKKVILTEKPEDTTIIEEVNWKIEMCRFGKKLHELDTLQGNLNSSRYRDKNSIKNVNFNYFDYTSAFSMDQTTMTFTFQKSDRIKGILTEDGKYFDDVYIQLKGDTDTVHAVIPVDTATNRNEATLATSFDGQIVLSYRYENGDGNLYITRLFGNQWTKPKKFSKPINTKGWEENEFISSDGSRLFFTSSRDGGFGGKDIYMCKKLPDGEWGKALNLGSVINTPKDEEAPIVYSDGRTLFFSSNKYKQPCCYDIFSSVLSNDGIWSEPVKSGYPLKTAAEEILYSAVENKNVSDSLSLKYAIGKPDAYVATFTDQKKILFTVLNGRVMDIQGKTPGVKITITDNETGEVLNVYNSSYKTGEYLFPLPPERNNNITYESDGYLFQSENIEIDNKAGYYEIHRVILLSPVVAGSKVKLNNIFFNPENATLRSVSNVELNRLFLFLFTNPDLSVELSCYSDDMENYKYNAKLAHDRAQAVVDFLLGKGIDKDRMVVMGTAGSENTLKRKKMKTTKRNPASLVKNNHEVDSSKNVLELKITCIKKNKK